MAVAVPHVTAALPSAVRLPHEAWALGRQRHADQGFVGDAVHDGPRVAAACLVDGELAVGAGPPPNMVCTYSTSLRERSSSTPSSTNAICQAHATASRLTAAPISTRENLHCPHVPDDTPARSTLDP